MASGLRARHGDAPRWVLWPVLLTWVGIPLGVLVYVAFGIAIRWNDFPFPGPAISVVVVLALLWLSRGAVVHRPLIVVDRTYLRLAVVVIGGFGLMGSWRVGAVVAVLVLLHSLVVDRGAEDSPDHPIARS